MLNETAGATLIFRLDGALVGVRDKILEAIKANNFAKEEDNLVAKALAAYLYILTMEKNKAIQSLSPFVERSETSAQLILNEVELNQLKARAEVREINPLFAGMIFTQTAILCYRCFEYKKGERLVSKAKRLFDLSETWETADDTSLLLARWENEIYWARIEWRTGRLLEAEKRLDNVAAEIVERYRQHPGENTTGGFDNLLAVALSLMASLAWVQGDHETGRLLIHRALFLLSCGTVRDELRQANTLYLAGKLEASFGPRSLSWAVSLEERAEVAFDRMEEYLGKPHPWRLHATLQKAKCLINLDELEEARLVLEDVEKRLEEILVDDPEEMGLLQAEKALSLVWIEERQAETNPTAEQWEKCFNIASKIAHYGNIPPRLKAESDLHLGRALANISGRENDGREYLQEALSWAHQHNRVKIEIASYLALTESYLSTEKPKAMIYWKDSQRLLEGAPSSYLRKWSKRLAPLVQGSLLIDIEKPFEKAKETFESSYFIYHAARTDWDQPRFTKVTGLDRNKYYRMKRKYDKEQEEG